MVTVFTLLSLIEGAALVVAFLTLGLGLILLGFLLNACLVLWAFLPAALLWRTFARWPAVAVGTGAVAFAYLTPGPLADRAVALDLASRSGVAAAPLDLPATPGVEFRTQGLDAQSFGLAGDDRGSALADLPCDTLCERLLLGGAGWVRVVLDYDQVRIVSPDGRTSHSEGVTSQALLVRGDADACRAANPDMISGPCVLYAPDDGRVADLVLVLEAQRERSDRKGSLAPYEPWSSLTAKAYLGPNDRGEEVFRATQIRWGRPIGPIVHDVGSPDRPHGGVMLMREAAATAPVDLPRALATLGVPLASPRPAPAVIPNPDLPQYRHYPPDALDTARVASLLAMGPNQGASYSAAFVREIDAWHARLRWKPDLTAFERRLFCESLTATDANPAVWASDVMERHGFECP